MDRGDPGGRRFSNVHLEPEAWTARAPFKMPPIRDMGRYGRNQRCRVKDQEAVILGRARSMRPPATADPSPGCGRLEREPAWPLGFLHHGNLQEPQESVLSKAPDRPLGPHSAWLGPLWSLQGMPHPPTHPGHQGDGEGPAKAGSGWRCTPPIAMLLPQIRGGPGNLPGMGVEKVRPISFNSPSHLESQPWNARSSSSSPMPPSVA